MFGQGGSLFNLSLGDLGRFLEKANADPTRKTIKELNKVSQKLDALNDTTAKQLKVDKDAFEAVKKDLRKRRGTLRETRDKQQVEKAVKPRRKFNEVLDDLTGDFINLRELSTGGIAKMTLGAISASFAPVLLSYSEMNDIINEIGINTDHIHSTFKEINAETQELVRRNERLRGTSIGHLQTLISTQEVYGTMADVSIETLDTVESFPMALGLSVEQGREFLNTMRGITAEGADFNASIMRSMALLSEGSNVPMGWIMNDISENAEFFAQRSGQGMENIASSVVHARRLGIQMATITNMLSGLDTVESVIESQMKLSLFTGEQINLLDSATANFFGDTEEATMSLLDEIGKIEEETFKLPFVRKQMAEQLNVSATEMNNIYESVRRIGTESTAINFGLTDDIESFQEMFSGLGMTRVRRSLNENLFNPIRNALNENMGMVDKTFDILDSGIKKLGGFVAPLVEAMPSLVPIGIGIVGSLSAIGAGNLIQMKQVGLLTQIRNILGADKVGGFFSNTAGSGKNKLLSYLGLQSYGGGQRMAGGGQAPAGGVIGGRSGGMRKFGALGKGLGALGAIGGTLGTIAEMQKEQEDRSLGAMVGNMAMLGAGIGSIIPGGGTLLGAGIGAGAGALGGLAMHGGLAEGGIATTPMLSPIAETRPEAVIPLDSSKTKEMMTLNLTDTSIEKLARAISKEDTNITIDYRYNGKKMDDSEQFFDEIRR